MDSSTGVGLMAVFAVSGSVAFIALKFHNRLLSDFMKKFEREFGGLGKNSSKKKVRPTGGTTVPSPNNKEHPKRSRMMKPPRNNPSRAMEINKNENAGNKRRDVMPENRKVLYKALIQNRALHAGN